MNKPVQPIYILPEGTQRTIGRDAQRNNIMAAKLIAEAVRTTLGPKGMDKMLVDSLGEIVVTNDGVTILQEMNIEHPAAKMVVEIAKTQEEQIGDGTTTAVVIAGQLLKKAEELLDKKIHPTNIIKGYNLASRQAIAIIEKEAESIKPNDSATLAKIAATAMTGKGAETAKEHLSSLCVKAIEHITQDRVANGTAQIDKDNIRIEDRVGGSIEDSELIEGIVLDKERVHAGMPETVKDAKILLLDSPIEVKETETDAKISITDPSQMQAFLDMEESMIAKMVDKIKKTGANVVLCQKGIDDSAQYQLAQQNILAVRRVKKSDLQQLARATGAIITNSIESATSKHLGLAGRVQERKVGDDSMLFVEQCPKAKSVTMLIRGGTEHVTNEVKRAIEDAVGDLVSAVSSGKVVAGAGSSEVAIASGLTKYATKLQGREQLAVKAFAEALEVIPATLAENAGLDPINVVAQLKSEHDANKKWTGIDVFNGKPMDAWKNGVVEPLRIKTQALSSASDVATMILRIDDVILTETPDHGSPDGNPSDMV